MSVPPLGGVLPSCTTVQDYDQVEVILQAYHGEPTNCNQRKLQELITSTALDKIVKLNSVNKTHGINSMSKNL